MSEMCNRRSLAPAVGLPVDGLPHLGVTFPISTELQAVDKQKENRGITNRETGCLGDVECPGWRPVQSTSVHNRSVPGVHPTPSQPANLLTDHKPPFN